MPYPRELPERPIKFNYGFVRKCVGGLLVVGVGFVCLAHFTDKIESKMPHRHPNDPAEIVRKNREGFPGLEELPPGLFAAQPASGERRLAALKDKQLHRDLKEELKKTDSVEKDGHKHFTFTKKE